MRCCPQVSQSLSHSGFFADSFCTRLIENISVLFPGPLRFRAQVHGIANDTIKFVQNIINTEINSATDNPVSFPQNLEFHIAFFDHGFFLNRCPRWYLQKEERPFRVGISTVNIRLRYACSGLFPHFYLSQLNRVLSLSGSGLLVHCSARAGLYQRAQGGEVVQPVPQRAAGLPGQRGGTQLGLHDRSLHGCSTGFMFTTENQQPGLLHLEPLTATSVIFLILFSV